jgi:AraC-like DNA-binding protein
MGQQTDVLAVSAPGLRAVRWWSDELVVRLKEDHVVARVVKGRSSFSTRDRTWSAGPGALRLQQPGDVHRDLAHDGESVCQIVIFPSDVVEGEVGAIRVAPCLGPGDPRGAALHRLHDAVAARADRLALEALLVEAIASLHGAAAPSDRQSHAVRRASDLLRARLEDGVTLDELAAGAGVDKFRLCRAFRAEIGIPPHAYLTHLRVERAKKLLRDGVPVSDVAQQVGMYDQSQLHRHFRRIVGATPGAYARG